MRKSGRAALIYTFIFLMLYNFAFSMKSEYLRVQARKGDGVNTLLVRYDLTPLDKYAKEFRKLNRGQLDKRGGLKLGTKYRLPVRIYKYNGKNIRSTIGISDYDKAKGIQHYNESMHKAGLKASDFRKDNILWVPVFGFHVFKAEKNVYPIFGKDFEDIEQIDDRLEGRVYYLVGGHGGPDPGAQGKRNGHTLCEDEYAYEVTIRLARRLLEHSATVYMIVRDSTDGIRTEQFLKCDRDEFYFGGDTIDVDQLTRLKKRVEIVNKLYDKNKKAGVKHQQLVAIHVDSRSVGKRIDIFFYHNAGSAKGKKLANIMQDKVRAKYNLAQPGRGYKGSVSSRGLYMLRKTKPVSVYIELGNIQNTLDQARFLKENNRQAMANWLCEALLQSAK
jgi:N-acetylmuramoyl-L-alanine amidase